MTEIHDKHNRGFISFESNGFITVLYVDSDQRNKGIGSKLIQKCVKWAKDKKLERLYLMAEPAEKENREDLVRFYEKNGFSVVEGNRMEINLKEG
jgi:GNAT superfamily N-acetyltransferase